MSGVALFGILFCFVMAFWAGKKYPLIAGAFLSVAVMIVLWAPGGLAVAS